MATKIQTEPLAIAGGPKAFPAMDGQQEPKIGVAEFISIAERFGFSDEALARIQASVSDADLGTGPNLARYATAYPPNPKGVAFEAAACDLFGTNYALGVSSGTAALHCAFVAVGVGPGREVIVPAVGFYATAAAVLLAGGTPVFCDVDESLAIDPAQIEQHITPETVAIVPTHVMGSVCDMPAIMAVARKYNLKVIEDCAQSPGGKVAGNYVGTHGDIGCFSISAYKIIGGGEGGLIITDNERLWERANQFAESGGLWRPDRFAPPRYEGELFVGTNYRMSELEAAVDVVQMEKLPDIVVRFHNVKFSIINQLKRYKEIVPQKLNDVDGEIGYLLRFYPETVELGSKIVEALNAEGIRCYMRGEGAKPDWHVYADMFPIQNGVNRDERHPSLMRGACPVADDIFNRNITIPLNQWYSRVDCANYAAGINKVLDVYCTVDPNGQKWY